MTKVEAVVTRERVETVIDAALNGGTLGSPVGPLLHSPRGPAPRGLSPGQARLRPPTCRRYRTEGK